MMIRMPQELRGAEVLLRPIRMGDAAELAAAGGGARDTFGFTGVPGDLAAAQKYVATALKQQEAGERFAFTTVWRDRVVGSTSYYDFQPWSWPAGDARQRTDTPDAVEIGYTWLGASAQRTRCNTEAKYLMLKYAFEDWQVYRVALRTDERNARSRAAIERIGGKFEGVRRAHLPASDGQIRNTAYFSILRAEWPEVCARLEVVLGTRR